jgi:hypothetical protein
MFNLSGQLYSTETIGILKTQATIKNLQSFSGYETVIEGGTFGEESLISDVLFCCADSMDIRKLAFEKWQQSPTRKVFVDTRTSADSYQIFFVTPKNEGHYLKHWFPQDEAQVLTCSNKSTTHIGSMCTAEVTSKLTRWGMGFPVKGFTSYIATLDLHKSCELDELTLF